MNLLYSIYSKNEAFFFTKLPTSKNARFLANIAPLDFYIVHVRPR